MAEIPSLALSYERLRMVIEKKMFSNTKDLTPVISFNAKASKEDQEETTATSSAACERGVVVFIRESRCRLRLGMVSARAR